MADADMNKVVAILARRLPNTVPTFKVEGLAGRAAEHFLSRTGRRTVPERASFLLIDIAVQLYRMEQAGESRPVTSIKRGDTTIQYGGAETGLEGFETRLQGFRVVRSR